ncbi:MAG: MCE family protein [Acidimicrobiia bacterium]|nr:MCE family protein [Acidimicrobiia bacterium]
MTAFRERNPYLIGITTVLILGALVGVAFAVGILHLLEKTYTVKAEFSDAAGITSGTDVRVAGIKCGRVTGIQADRRRGRVIITMHVNHGVHLGSDTHAEVALETLLGTRYVRLSGPVVKPYLEDEPEAARTISNDRTKTPYDIFDLVKVSTRSVEATDTAKLNQFITQLADVTGGEHDQLAQLLTGVNQVSSAVNDREAQLRQLLDRFDQLSGVLAEKDQTLVSLIDQSQGILNLVEQRRNDIASGLQSTDQLTGQLSVLLSANKGLLNSILATLHPTLDIVSKNEAHVDAALSWLGPGSLGLAKATTHGPWADIYVRSIGPDIPGVLCGVIKPPGVQCPS